MYTVVETLDFQAMAIKVWDVDTHLAFVDFIAANPEAGEVIPEGQGARKVRWKVAGRGKRGGSRVIYFNQLEDGQIVLLAVYAKSEKDDLPRKKVRKLKNEAEKHGCGQGRAGH
jgi:mRNA-degrading endonuclease RelE of RelBE toxin-antitoxin system